MAFYPQSILDEIRDRVSVVSYIGEHIPLKKSGRNYKGLCPFHSEKTPSFMVSDEKEIFHCFGCGEGGNIFGFVMKYEGLSFSEAVEHLASRAGVTLPKRTPSREEQDKEDLAARKKKLLFRINQIAAEFFRDNLKNRASGEPARNYLKYRRIFDEISTQHFLGYADDKWDALTQHLEAKNVPLQLAEDLGLIKRRSTTGEYYDFFRGRLIFPIVSPRSEMLGFGGRVITEGGDTDAAKYLNSPDSTIYHKSYSVYGLNAAQTGIRQADRVIIVEGYMDVLALNQAGIPEVVAPLGTALTTSQLRLLGRYTKNMVLIFDGDEAGAKAAERSLPGFLEVGIMPKVVILPEGEDPDDWIHKNSREDLDRLVKDADTLFTRFVKKLASDCGADLSKKFKAVSGLAAYFNYFGSSVEFMHYRKLLADEFKVDENDLARQFAYRGRGCEPFLLEQERGAAGRLNTEKLLLALLLEYPDYISRAGEVVGSSSFSDGSFKTLFELLLSEVDKGKVSVGRLLDMVVDDELKNTIHLLLAGGDINDENAAEIFEDCVKRLAKFRLSEQLKKITEEIKVAEGNKDEEKVLELMSEKNRLLSQGA